jgi:hypothetical protein
MGEVTGEPQPLATDTDLSNAISFVRSGAGSEPAWRTDAAVAAATPPACCHRGRQDIGKLADVGGRQPGREWVEMCMAMGQRGSSTG